jgi:hypothetical protein
VAVTGRSRATNPPKRKRKLSPKQIKIFGTKRQKNALKAKRNAQRTRTAPNGRKRRTNPGALVLTLGPVLNPHRSKATMAKTKANKKRAMNPKRRRVATNRRRVAKNAHRPRTRTITKTKVVYRAKPNKRRNKRRNPTKRVVVVNRRRNSRKRRNPDFFGSSLTSKQSLMILGGGFAGLIGTKFIPTLLPASLTGSVGTSTTGQFVLSLASALAVGWAAGKFVNIPFGNGAMFGGLIQAASVGLNAFLPSVYSSLGIGLGDLLPGSFTVPQNPIRAGMRAPAQMALPAPAGSRSGPPAGAVTTGQGGQARVTMSGLARAYGSAY